MPRIEKRLRDQSYYSIIQKHIYRLSIIRKEDLKNAWGAVSQTWKDAGEGAAACLFEKNHIKKNQEFLAGYIAFGLCNNTNPVEQDFHYAIKRPLLRALRKIHPKARVKHALVPAIRALFNDVIPKLSEDVQHRPFETYATPDAV